LSDEQWPRHPAHSPLIPLALLKAAGAPVAGTPEADARIARITARLLQSAPSVCLSVSLSAGGSAGEDREQRWSPLFSGPMFAGVAFSEAAPRIEPSLAGRFAPAALESISDETAPAMAATEALHGGAALLEEQSNCPFRAFAIRRLRAKQDAGPNEALAPFERGRIVERALEWLWKRLENSSELQRAELPRLLAEAVDAAIGSVLDAPAGDRWTLRFRALERQRTIEVLTEWLRVEASRPPFRVLGHQLNVELELAGRPLRGRLDRLDAVDGAQLVIDYKTGARNSPGAWQLPRPRLPQLPFYALARLVNDEAQKDNVAGISFAVVCRGECGFRSYLRDKSLLSGASQASRSFARTSFDDSMALWREELERIVRSFAAGDAAVDPRVPRGRSDSPCGHCHLGSFCRIGDEPGGDEAGSDEPGSDELGSDADGEAESEGADGE
jgi:probable DNA repair protein